MHLPAGVRIIGIDDHASYSVPSTLFDVLDPSDPRRKTGTVGLIVSIAVAADVPITAGAQELQPILQKVASKEIASQLTLFRVTVSESDNPNHNPAIDDLLVDGSLLPRGATVQMTAYDAHLLDLTAHDYEKYDEATPATGVQHLTERIVAAWYTTAGRFDHDRVALTESVKARLTAPGSVALENDPIPDDRRGTLWAVVRDSRGGQSWSTWPWWLCDPSQPRPIITSVETTSGTLTNPGTLTLHGVHLDQIMNVYGSGAVLRGAYSPQAKTWAGDAPILLPVSLGVTSRSCETQPVWVEQP
jgi:hypothetical protein